MKHTKGKWETSTENESLFIKGVEGVITRYVCQMVPGYIIKDEDRANAQLIASAPELLEALKKVQANLLNGVKPYCDEFSTPVQIIEEAIKKAEGN